MPIQPCSCPGGKKGRRWGHAGKCYCGKGAATKAGHQAAAAYAHGYHEASVSNNPLHAAGACEDGADAASPRFDEKMLRKLLEKCRQAREARRR